MTVDDGTRRYKHTGSRGPVFLFAEHFDHETKVSLTTLGVTNSARVH